MVELQKGGFMVVCAKDSSPALLPEQVSLDGLALRPGCAVTLTFQAEPSGIAWVVIRLLAPDSEDLLIPLSPVLDPGLVDLPDFAVSLADLMRPEGGVISYIAAALTQTLTPAASVRLGFLPAGERGDAAVDVAVAIHRYRAAARRRADKLGKFLGFSRQP